MYFHHEKVHSFLKKKNCKLSFYDPIVNYWKYSGAYTISKKHLRNYDVYIYLVRHQVFKNLKINFKRNALILDLNHVLDPQKRENLKNKNYKSYFIGSKIS